MDVSKKEYTQARGKGMDDMEKTFFFERKVETIIHIVALTIIVAVTQFFYPTLTLPLVVVWLGITINSKLIAVYYMIKMATNVHTGYFEEMRSLGWDLLKVNGVEDVEEDDDEDFY